MNKAVKTTLSLASAVLTTPLYFAARNFKKNSNMKPVKRVAQSLAWAGLVSGLSFLTGLEVNQAILNYDGSKPSVCAERIDEDYYSLTSTQRTFVTSMPTRDSYFSFATPIAPIIQHAFGEFPEHKITIVGVALEHDSIEYNLKTTLNGHVPLKKIDAEQILESAPEIRVKESSMEGLLKECGL